MKLPSPTNAIKGALRGALARIVYGPSVEPDRTKRTESLVRDLNPGQFIEGEIDDMPVKGLVVKAPPGLVFVKQVETKEIAAFSLEETGDTTVTVVSFRL